MSNIKTPTSVLLEFVVSRNLNCDFDITQWNEGFQCTCTVNKETVMALGSSKQKAKHKASELMLQSLANNAKLIGHNDDSTIQIKPHINYVGRLQELTQKQKLPHPEYSCTIDPTNNMEICTVKLAGLSITAMDLNKKMARHKAAHDMLNHLDIATNELGKQFDLINMEEDVSSSINQSFSSQAKDGGTMRLSRLCPTIVHASMYQQILEDIARIHKFECTPVSLNELTADGEHQCLLQLSTCPVSVFHGKGNTRDEAYASAILNSISYLKYTVQYPLQFQSQHGYLIT